MKLKAVIHKADESWLSVDEEQAAYGAEDSAIEVAL